ncbi:hypothetical protein [Paraburkholderia flava]|uniref:hypothetical protein n=1 Tax=Paraburkholderia flava TaxID=2547393 RepID=UPI00105B943A|nr:hypothetical protein [Paraburkholderia flava]
MTPPTTSRYQSWSLTALVGIVCAAVSAYINLAGSHGSNVAGALAQAQWIAGAHIGAALLGSVLLARFVQGSPAALQGPAARSTVANAPVLTRGVDSMRIVVPGKNAFFSGRRTLQLLGFIFCLMLQFVSAAPPGGAPGAAPSVQPVAARHLAT